MKIILFGIVLFLQHSRAHPSTQPANDNHVPHLTEQSDLKDGEIGKQIIGSRILSSVSVILNGEEPHFTDAIGQPIPKQQIPLQVASPINLLNPDRYEFYTFDNNGNLIKRLMTIKEIQSIVANGDGEDASVLHNLETDNHDPEKNVQDIVESVQNVLHKQVEENKNSSEQQHPQNIMLDTPDVSSSWSMILPAIFGNTGSEIFSQNRPQQVVMIPDSDVVEPKPVKRKPKPKPTKNKTTSSTTIATLTTDTNTNENRTKNSTTEEVYIFNKQELIKPLFNRNELKIESASEVAEMKSTTPKLQPTKKKNKLKPSKIENTDLTSNKSGPKRKYTTTRSSLITTLQNKVTTIPTTPTIKIQATRRKQTTRNPTINSGKPEIVTSNVETLLKKHRVNATTNFLSTSSYNISTKQQIAFTKTNFASSTKIPAIYTISTTNEKRKNATQSPTTANTTKQNENKYKIPSVTPISILNLKHNEVFHPPSSTIKNIKLNLTDTTIKSSNLLNELTLADNKLSIQNQENFSPSASISYDMLTGQDATTKFSLNAIMNTLTHPQNDVKSKLSFNKIMNNLKYNTSLVQDINNITQITQPAVETTTLSINDNETDRTNADIQKTEIFSTTIFTPLKEKEKIQNNENMFMIEPFLNELLDSISFTTEKSDFTTTENWNENEKLLESTESITEPGIKKDENENQLFGGSNELVQRVDEFINKNLDTVETAVPVKELTNKLSSPESFNKDNKSVMSDLIKEAATVASILEDNTKEFSSEFVDSEINDSDEIQSLLTEVISQMTNTPTFASLTSPSTIKPVNIKYPIFYSNQQMNPIPSYNNTTEISAVLLATTNTSHSQEFLGQLHTNDKSHLSGVVSSELNQTNKNPVEHLYPIHNTNNKKIETTLTPIQAFTAYDDDNYSNFDSMNLANNSDNTILSFEDSTSQNKTNVENLNEILNTTKSDIFLSTPVSTKDDAILITTLMESMVVAIGTETTSLSPFETFSNKTTTTEASDISSINYLETFKPDKQFEREEQKGKLSTIAINKHGSATLSENYNKDTNDSSKTIKINKNNIKDKHELVSSQDDIIKEIQKTTEIPLQMTTIFPNDENNDIRIESILLQDQGKKEIINNKWEAITFSNVTKMPYNNYNKESTVFDSDESVAKFDGMSTIKYIDSTENVMDAVTMVDELNNLSNSFTINNKIENFNNGEFILNSAQLSSSQPVTVTFAQKSKENEESYEKLGEPNKHNTFTQKLNSTTDNQLLIKTSTISNIGVSTVQYTSKRPQSTLKPVHYFKQPTSITDQKLMSFNGSQQRPIIRPPSLSNLKITQISQLTRPPVKLDPSPEKSLGLEASIMDLQEDIQEFARLCNELAFNYWRSITSEKISAARSLVISPFALTSMLSMVFLGARGSTSGEMNEILRLDDMVTFNPHLVFKNITESVERANDNGIASSAFVRELFSDRNNGKILQFFKDKVHQFYSGHVEEVKFNVVNDIIRRRTNLLIKRHANGKVLEYLRTNSVWVNGPLSTVSANLFQTSCSKASTINRDGEMFFQVNPTVRQRRLVPIPAVVYRNGFTAGYDAELDATVVAFGSAEETVSTIYVMPGQHGLAMPGDTLERLEKNIMTNGILNNSWSHLLTSLMERPGLEIQLPRFSHRSFVNASFGLQKLGLKTLFNSDEADLRGLTGSSQKDVHLADMIQINTFSTCGEEKISNHHHVEMYPAPPLRKRNSDLSEFDSDTQTPSAGMHIDFGSLVQDAGRSLYDDLLDPKYLELPLPLRPRQARIPDSPRLRLDKPFIYFVRHNPTGMILFMGRFNPRLLP